MIPETLEHRVGKFSDNIQEAIYDIALDDGGGFGDVESFNYYSLVVFDETERAALLKVDYGASAAALLEETSTGAVNFRFFETEAEARAAFDAIQDEWNDAETEAEAEAERDRFNPKRDAFSAGD